MMDRVFKKPKRKLLDVRLIVILLLLLLTAPVFGNEVMRLYQFNRQIDQTKEEIGSKDCQRATEAFQKARNTLDSTLILKSLKKAEMEGIENEIKEIEKLINEEIAEPIFTVIPSPTFAPSPTQTPIITSGTSNKNNEVDKDEIMGQIERRIIEAQKTLQEPKSEEAPACPTLSDKYATIIGLEDSKGNVQRRSAHNNCTPSQGEFIVKNGETITVSVSVDNKKSDPVLYEFIGSGFPNKWQSSNSTTVTIDNKYESVHLRVFVKNSDDKFRAPDYDDMIQVFYEIVQ